MTARLDAHQHFWRYHAERDAWITDEMAAIRRDFLPAALEPELAAHSFDGSVAVQADQSVEETRFLLDLARRHAFVRGVVGWVDLVAPDLERALEELCEGHALVGVRHIAQAEPDDYLVRPDVVRGIECLGGFALTFDILVYERQLPAAAALVARLPDQRFVLDHAAKPRIRNGLLEPWATHLRTLARHANVSCKVSGLVTEADWTDWRPEQLRPYLDVVFDAFAPDRVLFGSDWPVCLLASTYDGVVHVVQEYAAGLTSAEREALFGGNAARWYGLDG